MNRIWILLLAVAVITGCKQSGEKVAESETASTTDSNSKGGITLTEVESPQYTDARLTLKMPVAGTHVMQGEVPFEFEVEQYELGAQTGDAAVKLCANSAKGQHIHLIVDNGPYSAHYGPSFKQEIADGRHIGLAFLSRSYHESIKTSNAYQLFHFSVGESEEAMPFSMESPHMFYSRPKGTYSGEDTKKVLLDFYLVNADLAANGFKVKATINGNEWILDKWVPYAMEGLPMGENTIELALIDKDGAMVESPYNPVTRTVTLEE